MPKRTRQIERLIINSPYDEPQRYWKYIREERMFEEVEGERRPAGYLVASPEAQGFDDPGVFVELPLVNQIRPRIKAWRDGGYPGVTGITRRLLEHWHDRSERQWPFFFCQLEAIETLIWLTEASPAERQGIDIPGDGGAFSRWCAKMATGSGKTIVMSMAIAWQVLNKTTYTTDPRFSKNVLVIAPGLTVKNRLSVLMPDSEGNYYDLFNIIPPGLSEKLRQGKVMVVNWHKLDWESEEQIAKRKSVDKRGARSDEAYVRDVLGEMANARNIAVFNDEAHHAWRIPEGGYIASVSRADRDEATKWIGGLDRIHRARGILRCFDFSATPFAPTGKKSSEAALFDWVVSDFGLNDAIEAGLVKTPRIVVRDDALPDVRTYKSKLYHIYVQPEVKDDLTRKAEEHEPLPDLVVNGYYLLGKDWQETKKDWEAHGHAVPPVMITVANRTETAARIKYAFDHCKIRIEELRNPERTLHIDSKVLDKAEQQDEPPEAPELGAESEPESEDGGDDETLFTRKLTKQEQAELLRRTVDTVGQKGQPGEQIQNVISVGMLSEGWDAKTVTHIMGLRAFSSQLLCEQVVGRGLRRTSYEVNPANGLFEPEYVNIFGVPFTFLPHEGDGGPPPAPPPPKTKVEPLKEREAEYGISWPNVVRIEHVYTPRLTLDLREVEVLKINASDTATRAELARVLGGHAELTALSEIDLEELGRTFRLQKIVFEVARDVFDQMKPTWRGNRDVLLAQLIGIVERVLRSDRIEIAPALFHQDELRRRIMMTLNMNRIVQHVWEAIRFENATALEPVFDSARPIMSTSGMQPWWTGRPCEHTRRSHINFCVFDSGWESTEAYELDSNEHVAAWVKNDHLGFDIIYVFNGIVRKYRPDFLIRLVDGTMLVLEVKGQDSQENQTKRRFLDEWVRGVNEHGGFGRWSADVSYDPADVAGILARHVGEKVAAEG